MNTLEQLQSGALVGATRVAISAGLESFPPELFGLAGTLQTLDLSGNRLSALPDDLGRFTQLRILFCSFNDFTRLPDVLGQCPRLEMIGFRANRISESSADSLPRNLRWLILTGNCIASLPERLGECGALQKLMLAGNRLSDLPASMQACDRLELLRLSANRFEALPAWLGQLPRLSWLGFSGNPCSDARERSAQASVHTPSVRWDALEIREMLGSGASGVIHRAIWRDGGAARDVAVKVFKGALTSDGLPHSEMVAWLAAGSHASLIGVLGRIVGHPENAEGLVMPLVDASYTVLAGPPSMQSCTRDVYDLGLSLSSEAARRVALSVASAASQLHARGILHTTFCTTGAGMPCWGISARRRFAIPTMARASTLSRWMCGRSGVCWKSWWIVLSLTTLPVRSGTRSRRCVTRAFRRIRPRARRLRISARAWRHLLSVKCPAGQYHQTSDLRLTANRTRSPANGITTGEQLPATSEHRPVRGFLRHRPTRAASWPCRARR